MTPLRPLDIRRALISFNLAVRAENKSPGTVELYSVTVCQLTDYLQGQGYSLEVGQTLKARSRRLRQSLNRVPDGLIAPTIHRNMALVYDGLDESDTGGRD